jgi:hypothetical protein
MLSRVELNVDDYIKNPEKLPECTPHLESFTSIIHAKVVNSEFEPYIYPNSQKPPRTFYYTKPLTLRLVISA